MASKGDDNVTKAPKPIYMSKSTNWAINDELESLLEAAGLTVNTAPDDVYEQLERDAIAKVKAKGLFKTTTRQPDTITRPIT
jgi:hypothetical protein